MIEDDKEIKPQTLDEILQTPSDKPVNKPTGPIPVPVSVGKGIGAKIKTLYQGDIEKDLEYPEDE